MNELNKHTPTELLHLINETKERHEKIKTKIFEYTRQVDELETKINENLKDLDDSEKYYIDLVEELNNR